MRPPGPPDRVAGGPSRPMRASMGVHVTRTQQSFQLGTQCGSLSEATSTRTIRNTLAKLSTQLFLVNVAPFFPLLSIRVLPKCRDPVHSCSFLIFNHIPFPGVPFPSLLGGYRRNDTPSFLSLYLQQCCFSLLSSLRHRTPASIRETLRHSLNSASSIRPVLFPPANAV